MIIGCPKCKTKLKIADEKIKPEGLKIKCPKCATVLMVRRPAAKPAAPPTPSVAPPAPEKKTVVVGLADSGMTTLARILLERAGYRVAAATDGPGILLAVGPDRPDLVVLDAALPKIDGFEIARRLRSRPDISNLRALIVSSREDMTRARKHPASDFGVDNYIDIEDIEDRLAEAATATLEGAEFITRAPAREEAPLPQEEAPLPQEEAPLPEEEAPLPEEPPAPKVAPLKYIPPAEDEDPNILRARRLARTVFSDIDLYNPEKVVQAVKDDNFQTVFSNDLKEGLKHYRNRIPEEVRNKGDFFKDALTDFIARKKKDLGL